MPRSESDRARAAVLGGVQLDYLTPELYNRMNGVKRYLLEIEPPKPGDGILRQPKKDHKGWWN